MKQNWIDRLNLDFFTLKNVSIWFGTVLDYFDKTLLYALGILMVGYFIPSNNNTDYERFNQYLNIFLTYIVGRIGGAYVFARLAYHLNKQTVFYITIAGMSLSTLSIACIPSFNSIGFWSLYLFYLARASLAFFAAGESNLAKILLIEQQANQRHQYVGSYQYQIAIMMGSFLAYLLGFVVLNYYFTPNNNPTSVYPELATSVWKTIFIIAGLLSFVCFVIRYYTLNESDFKDTPIQQKSSIRQDLQLLYHHKWVVLKITLVEGLSSLTYYLPMAVLPIIVPLIYPQLSFGWMFDNTLLLHGYDIVLMYLIGIYLVNQKPSLQFMILPALVLALACPIMFIQLNSMDSPNPMYLNAIRLMIVTCGVVFVSTLTHFQYVTVAHYIQQDKDRKYLIISSSDALASVIFSKLMPILIMKLVYATQSFTLLGIFMGCYSLLVVAILYSEKNNYQSNTQPLSL